MLQAHQALLILPALALRSEAQGAQVGRSSARVPRSSHLEALAPLVRLDLWAHVLAVAPRTHFLLRPVAEAIRVTQQGAGREGENDIRTESRRLGLVLIPRAPSLGVIWQPSRQHMAAMALRAALQGCA